MKATLVIIQRASATGPYIAIWRGNEPKNAHSYPYTYRNARRLEHAAYRVGARMDEGWSGTTIYPKAVRS